MSTATRAPIPASDQTWLHMDRPNNLMHVHSLMWFDGEPAWADLRRTVKERVVDKFPVFTRRAVEVDGEWAWEDDPEFDLRHHLRRVDLPAPGDVEALRAWAGTQFSRTFDPERPLWDMAVIRGVTGLEEQPVTVIFSRFHHALADGIRLVQLMLSMCDMHDEAPVLPPVVGRDVRTGVVAATTGVVKHAAGDALDIAKGLTSRVLRLPLAVTRLRPSSLEHGLETLVHPERMIDAVSALSSLNNQSANTVTELTRLMAAGRSVETSWSGVPGVAKRVDWVVGLDLDRIKKFGKEYHGTVNDALLAVLSRALTRYLDEKDALVDEIHWLVPVSLLPMDENLPAELGNHFSLIFMSMPLGIGDPQELVQAIQQRMTRLKESAEPVVTFGIQWLLAESPTTVAVWLTNYFANKGVGVLTNVPGPRAKMSFAGVPVACSLGWAPTSGDQPMSLSIFSYNGQVSISIAADAHLVPDPERIAELVREEYDVLMG
ncbi:MAG TPA: WS/DGAT domain-containing protein [Nocardioides sp.]|uniref:WS/DGAT domain-containing protein n=1 Tax=Nocardioides sp. TaxID=35761 RepID=UPI002BAE6501|nr:WS/DGAT domain-containing protein [Nocardioides sp.]HQR26035.1 WS/DGAT domain-containing protein [Nocardioides sp.]